MTKKEKRLIVDALLFTSSSPIIINKDEKDFKAMVDLAEKLQTDPSEDLEYWGPPEDDELWAEDIPKRFKIKVNTL